MKNAVNFWYSSPPALWMESAATYAINVETNETSASLFLKMRLFFKPHHKYVMSAHLLGCVWILHWYLTFRHSRTLPNTFIGRLKTSWTIPLNHKAKFPSWVKQIGPSLIAGLRKISLWVSKNLLSIQQPPNIQFQICSCISLAAKENPSLPFYGRFTIIAYPPKSDFP